MPLLFSFPWRPGSRKESITMTKRKSRWAGIIAAGLTALLLLGGLCHVRLIPVRLLSLGWGGYETTNRAAFPAISQYFAGASWLFSQPRKRRHGVFGVSSSSFVQPVFSFGSVGPAGTDLSISQRACSPQTGDSGILHGLVLLRRFPPYGRMAWGAVWRFLWLLRVWPFGILSMCIGWIW